MIKDMLVGFKPFYEKYGDQPILEHYAMKQGLYFKVSNEGVQNSMYISQREKLKKHEDKELFNWFKEADYNSILPLYTTNKSIKSKSIHSNNFLSMFLRKETLLKKGKIAEKIFADIEAYFDKIETFFESEEIAKTTDSKKAKVKILELAPFVNKELFISSKQAIVQFLKNISDYMELLDKIGDKDYIRIFFDTDIVNYRTEYKRYMLRKVFNKDNYHTIIDGEVVGLPNQDMGTNSKKPSLELKSMKAVVPIRVNFETAILSQKLYDFLYFYNVPRRVKGSPEVEYVHALSKTLYIPYDWDIVGKDLNSYTKYNSPMHYVRTGMGTSFSILDYDIIPPFNKEINFKIDNVLEKQSKNEDSEEFENVVYKELIFINELENKIDYTFFNYKLSKSYFDDKIVADAGMVSKNIISILKTSKKPFYEWFKKGNELSISHIIDKVTFDVINEYMTNLNKKEDTYKIVDMMNLRIALLKYFDIGGNELHQSINDIRKSLNDKLKRKTPSELSSDSEFFYLAGQLAYYFTTKSASAKKMQNMSKPYLNSRTVSNMKDKLTTSYDKYSHAISMSDIRFKKAYTMIMSYISNAKFKDYKDIFLAGFLSQNIIFYKKSNKKAERSAKQNEK